MEENNEKKKHSRKRFYRGKNNDRSKDKDRTREERPEEDVKRDKPEKNEKPEKPARREKAEKNERSEKPERGSNKGGSRGGNVNQEKSEGRKSRDRGERQDKGEKQEKSRRREERRTQRKETPADPAPEEKFERSRREPEETIFDFTWADAWGLYGVGYHIVIKDNQERMYLSWSVDLSYGEMKIGQRLKEFLDDMKRTGLNSWDGRRYTKPGIFDGDTWSLKINSLSLKCEAQGTNEYPEEWKEFLKCLHEKWGIPVSRREQWE